MPYVSAGNDVAERSEQNERTDKPSAEKRKRGVIEQKFNEMCPSWLSLSDLVVKTHGGTGRLYYIEWQEGKGPSWNTKNKIYWERKCKKLEWGPKVTRSSY